MLMNLWVSFEGSILDAKTKSWAKIYVEASLSIEFKDIRVRIYKGEARVTCERASVLRQYCCAATNKLSKRTVK